MALEEIVAANAGKWLPELLKVWRGIGQKRKAEIESVNALLRDPEGLAKVYVEPDCQKENPADSWPKETWVRKRSAKEEIQEFLAAPRSDQAGQNQMIILGDAGMGKTALVCMMKMLHIAGFLRHDKACVLRRISQRTLDEIEGLESKYDTILLLDALDEDRSMEGSVESRVLRVLRATDRFHRVILTCRTQFFPRTKRPENAREGLTKIGAEGGRIAELRYLSYFDDAKVAEYLENAVPEGRRAKAQQIVKNMRTLQCRPLMLAYINDLMDCPSLTQGSVTEYELYTALVDRWLWREVEEKGAEATAEELLKACMILATRMFLQEDVRGMSAEACHRSIETEPALAKVGKMDLTGRSLLNRSNMATTQDYVFAHFTIQEYLLARRILDDHKYRLNKGIELTAFVGELLATEVSEGSRGAPVAYVLKRLHRTPRARNTVLSARSFRDDRFDRERWWLPFSEAGTRLGFIDIAGGTFLFGEKKIDMHVGRFLVAKYPVTVAQFGAFVNDSGYETKYGRWELGAGGHHPVAFVSFDDAAAYCEWLTRKLGHLGEFADVFARQRCRAALPTEVQWERAARHTDGREYPWGNGGNLGVRCNMDRCGIGTTSAVGCFPSGRAECGAEDMAGNVWEWAVVQHGLKSNAPVLCGGAFYNNATNVRCVSRLTGSASYRSENRGFRVVLSPF